MCHYHLSGISDGNTVDRAAARANSSEMKDQGLTHPEPHSFSSLLFQSSIPGLCTFSSRNFQHLGWLVKHKPLAVEETTQFILSHLPPLKLLRSSQLPQWGSEQPVVEAQGISCVCRTNQVEGMLLKLPMGFPIHMVCQHPKTLHAHVLGHDNPCLTKERRPPCDQPLNALWFSWLSATLGNISMHGIWSLLFQLLDSWRYQKDF